MQLGVCKRLHAPLGAARAWPLWELPRWLVSYIAAVVATYLVVLTVVSQFYALSRASSSCSGRCCCAAARRLS